MEYLVSPDRKRIEFGVHCMAPGCHNYYGKNNSVHYHQLSQGNDSLLGEWMVNMPLARPPKLQHARVCSEHFVDDDYLTKGGIVTTMDGLFG